MELPIRKLGENARNQRPFLAPVQSSPSAAQAEEPESSRARLGTPQHPRDIRSVRAGNQRGGKYPKPQQCRLWPGRAHRSGYR